MTVKRKPDTEEAGDAKRRMSDPSPEDQQPETEQQDTTAVNTASNDAPAENSSSASASTDRAARFAALKARSTDSRKANMKATTTEKQRLSVNPAALTSINKKKDVATHRILKADTEEAGEDFERKRAWDWTIEESEKWDKHLEKKQRQQNDVGFQDFTNEARKIYKRHIKHLKPDRDAYEQEKAALLEKAAASGGLEIVETDDGELIAIDRDGKFYSTAESTEFVTNKPSKEAVDRLVGEMRKQEELRLKKRKNKGADDGDITYINDANKQFNQKLARYAFSHRRMRCWLTYYSAGSTTSTLPTFGRALSAAQRYEWATHERHDTKRYDDDRTGLLYIVHW